MLVLTFYKETEKVGRSELSCNVPRKSLIFSKKNELTIIWILRIDMC